MFRLILFIISISIFWGGGQSLYMILSNSEITELSCADFLEGKSDKDWFSIPDCYSANSDVIMVYEEGDAGTQSDFFLPLYTSETEIGFKPIKAYLKLSSNADKVKIVKVINAQTAKVDMDEFYKNNPEIDSYMDRYGLMEINGLVSFGLEETDENVRDTLVRKAGNDNFIIIDQNAQPDPLGMAISMLVFGLIIFGWVMWSFSREQEAYEGT